MIFNDEAFMSEKVKLKNVIFMQIVDFCNLFSLDFPVALWIIDSLN